MIRDREKNRVTLNKVTDFVRHMCVDPENQVAAAFWLNGDRCDFYDLAGGDLIQSTPLRLDAFKKEQKLAIIDETSFDIQNGQPVKGVVFYRGLMLVLVENENERETTYLMVFGSGGKELGKIKTPGYYRRICAEPSSIYLIEDERGFIDVFPSPSFGGIEAGSTPKR